MPCVCVLHTEQYIEWSSINHMTLHIVPFYSCIGLYNYYYNQYVHVHYMTVHNYCCMHYYVKCAMSVWSYCLYGGICDSTYIAWSSID